MKRHMDLIRSLLLLIEDEHDNSSAWKIEGYTSKQIEYHLELLQESGYIREPVKIPHPKKRGVFIWQNLRLTMYGQDFLDNVRNPKVWAETQKRIGDTVGSISLEIVKMVA